MPHIDHPARQGDDPSVADWLRYRIGTWMQTKGAALEYRALYPDHVQCPECGSWNHPKYPCDHIPF